MGTMRYKPSDKVRIKSLDWYNKNKDEFGNIDINEDFIFYADRSKYCGKVFTISKVFDNSYLVKEDNNEYYWSDEMIEGLMEEETKNWANTSIPDGPYTVTYDSPSMNDSMNKNNINNEIILPKGYIFKDENGNVINAQKIVLEKKRKEYPKTYDECCKVLNTDDDSIIDISVPLHYNHLLISFTQLLICRDAYWKLYGEEMGLGKPWKLSIGIPIYYIYYNRTVDTIKNDYADDIQGNVVLAFPTEEMRDAFYENFKKEIEICKELL